MNAIKGIYKNGQIILDRPADWPEETEVLVEPLPQEQTLGIREEDWPTDAEGIARWMAAFDAILPLQMTTEEEAEWQAAREAQKAFELARWEERARRIERLFD